MRLIIDVECDLLGYFEEDDIPCQKCCTLEGRNIAMYIATHNYSQTQSICQLNCMIGQENDIMLVSQSQKQTIIKVKEYA